MATHSKTRKVNQIKKNPKIGLHYFDKDGVSYVTVIGHASLVTDLDKRKEFWNNDWEDFYSDSYRGNDYILIRTRPIRIEVVSYKHGIAADPGSWRPAIVEFPE